MTANQRAGIPSRYPGIPTWIMDNLKDLCSASCYKTRCTQWQS